MLRSHTIEEGHFCLAIAIKQLSWFWVAGGDMGILCLSSGSTKWFHAISVF
jgi:hypothetical protein